jgi:hypothetical protein
MGQFASLSRTRPENQLAHTCKSGCTMQFRSLGLILGLLALSAPTFARAQTTSKAPAPTVKKAPSRARQVAGKLADTAVTTVAGIAADSLLGKAGTAMANKLGLGTQPCLQGAGSMPAGIAGLLPGVSAGTAVVGAAKKALLKRASDSAAAHAAAPVPCPTAAAAIPGMPGVSPNSGMPGSPLGMMAAATPIGMAVMAAPLAGKAAKGVKGLLGGKPQDKIAMLRELGKGRLELKDVKFIEGTAEMVPGYEASFAELGEAIGMAEGTYILYVAAEEGGKGEMPDTALARKRLEKVWAGILVNGVSAQRIIAAKVLPPALDVGRKPPKKGQARIELIRLPGQF